MTTTDDRVFKIIYLNNFIHVWVLFLPCLGWGILLIRLRTSTVLHVFMTMPFYILSVNLHADERAVGQITHYLHQINMYKENSWGDCYFTPPRLLHMSSWKQTVDWLQWIENKKHTCTPVFSIDLALHLSQWTILCLGSAFWKWRPYKVSKSNYFLKVILYKVFESRFTGTVSRKSWRDNAIEYLARRIPCFLCSNPRTLDVSLSWVWAFKMPLKLALRMPGNERPVYTALLTGYQNAKSKVQPWLLQLRVCFIKQTWKLK
jgi:hypothetical protein